MKVILIIEIPDEVLEKQGYSPEECIKEYEELKDELTESCPDGFTVTLKVER